MSWPVVASVAALTWVWLVGGIAAAWCLSQWPTVAEVAVSPPTKATAVAEVPPPVAAKPVAIVEPVDDTPGAVKGGPSVATTTSPTPPVTPVAIPRSDPASDVEVIANLLDRAPPPAVCDPKANKVSSCGTSVKLVPDPDVAAKEALKEHKLLFVIHLAGNLEESKFT